MDNHTDILIIDVFNMIARTKSQWTMNDNMMLSSFIHMFYSTVRQFDPKFVIMPFDDYIGNNFRRKILPEYKMYRKIKNDVDPNKEKFDNQKNKIINFIKKVLPVYCLKYKGYEADDIIYFICKLYPNKNIVIWSNDHDFIQLQQKYDNVKIWNPKSKKFFDNPVYNMVFYKSLMGDKSDNIPAVSGITSKNIYNTMNNPQIFIKNISSISKNFIQYNNNMKIIDLEQSPLVCPDNIGNILSKNVYYNYETFKKMIKNFNLKKIEKDFEKYHQCFMKLQEKDYKDA